VVLSRLAHLEIHVEEGGRIEGPAAPRPKRMTESRRDPAAAPGSTGESQRPGTIVNKSQGPIDPANPNTWGKVGRNDACPCGSGKKFKHCHGTLA
jgi:preprotein translocase subunit SecA